MNFSQISTGDFKEVQKKDTIINRVIEYQNRGRFPSKEQRCGEPHKVKLRMGEWNNLGLENGILKCRKGTCDQLVVPRKFNQIVFCELHKETGHLGSERVIQLAKERCYWPRMVEDIIHYVTKVCRGVSPFWNTLEY